MTDHTRRRAVGYGRSMMRMTRCALSALVLVLAVEVPAGALDGAQVEPTAGAWRPWVLPSGIALRLPPPLNAQDTGTEMEWLRTLIARRDSNDLDRIRYWDFGSPAQRWNEILRDTAVAQNFGAGGGSGIRAYAMLNVAIYDALIAAWDSKYAYNRRRPGEADAQLVTAVELPRSPSYPCEHSVAAGAGSAVLAQLFPKEAARFN